MPDSTGALINQLMNPPDPFARLGSMAQGMSAARQFQADQAAAEAYRQSIDPETGQFDQAKFNAIASQAPGGSFNFGRQMQSAGTGLQAQSAGTSAQLDAQRAKVEGIAGQLYPLMQKVLTNQPVTGADLQTTLDQAKALDLTTPDMVKNMQKRIDAIGPTGDASGLVRGAMYGTLTAAQRYDAAIGRPTLVQQGPQATFAQPVPGAVPSPAGTIPMGLPPADIAARQEWLDGPGEFKDNAGNIHNSRRKMFEANGINPDSLFPSTAPPIPTQTGGPVPGGAPAPPPRGPASSVTTGRPPVAPQPLPPRTSATQPPAALPPGSPEPTPAMPADLAGAGRKAFDEAQAIQKTLPQRITPLTQGIGILNTHKGLQTVGQEELTQLQKVADAFGFPTVGMDNANAYQMLGKSLAQYTAQLPGGNRSDMAALGAAAQSAHIGQSREAIRKLMIKAVGLERMRGSAYDYFVKQYSGPEEAAKNAGQFNSKTTDFTKRQMPDAYALDHMTPSELHDFVKGLSPADMEQFKKVRKDLNDLYPEIQLVPERR